MVAFPEREICGEDSNDILEDIPEDGT